MLRVTFYSYKGGVGRTRALLNVAAILARAGKKVVAVDLDLEAPGFERSGLLGEAPAQPMRGVSDFCLDHLIPDCGEPVAAYVRSADGLRPSTPGTKFGNGALYLMPAGTRPVELARRLPDIYRQPDGDSARIFELLVHKIREEFEPDYLFFDSRTGLADIAGICTVELPELLVAVCGLNRQNLDGMERILAGLRAHPARLVPIPTLLVLSPIPRAQDLKLQPVSSFVQDLDLRHLAAELSTTLVSHPLLGKIFEAQRRLLVPLLQEFEGVPGRFRRLDPRTHLLHQLEYDPNVPLTSELGTVSNTLQGQYQRLAHVISLANLADNPYEPSSPTLMLPILVP